MEKKLYETLKANAEKLKSEIEKIPGEKIVTVNSSFLKDGFGKFDVGSLKTHPDFLKVLMEGMKIGAGIIVRQFTEEKIEKNTPKGKMMIPKKNIYGISCANNNYTWLVEESVFEAFYTDCKTGEMLDIEKDITCCGYYF
jgi:hypothetical protein